jgi:hypothetical protein
MTELQRAVLANLVNALALCRQAGLAMLPTIGGVRVMYRRRKGVWHEAGDARLTLPDIPEPIRNDPNLSP